MNLLRIVTGLLLSFTVGAALADVELSSLIEWEESQNEQVALMPASDNHNIKNNNSIKTTAAGQEQLSSLIEWEESQYAQPSALPDQSDQSIIANINFTEASTAGADQSEMSNLIEWEESF